MSIEWIIKILQDNLPMFLRGAGMTLLISIIGTLIGTLIGLLVGVIRTIPVPERGIKKVFLKIINIILSIYIEFFRGTPMIVQAMVIYYGSAQFLGIDINKIVAALFIVSINTGAYMSEIVRGGIVSVDNILPATGNEFVINIKDTSVLNVISVSELFFQTKSIAGNNFRYFESFFVACFIYFIMTYTVTRILRAIERKLDGPDNYIMAGNQMQVERPEDMLRKSKDNVVA